MWTTSDQDLVGTLPPDSIIRTCRSFYTEPWRLDPPDGSSRRSNHHECLYEFSTNQQTLNIGSSGRQMNQRTLKIRSLGPQRNQQTLNIGSSRGQTNKKNLMIESSERQMNHKYSRLDHQDVKVIKKSCIHKHKPLNLHKNPYPCAQSV